MSVETTTDDYGREFFKDAAGRLHPVLAERGVSTVEDVIERRRSRSWLSDVQMSTVIVLTTDDVSFKGLRRAVHDDCLILHEATVLHEDSTTVLNGDLVIPREKVLAVQLIEAS